MNNEKDFKDLPEGWKWVRLGEVVEEVNEKVGNKYLEPVAIGIQGVKKRSEIYYKDLAEDYSKNKVFKSDNVAFGLGSNEMAIGVNTSNQDYCISPAYRVFKLKEQDALYFHYFLSFFKKVVGDKFLILSARQGKTVDFERLFNEYIPLPPLPEQQKIAEILETIDNAIEKTDRIIEKYKRIKQGLMQDLLTKGIDEKGNIRNEKTHKFKDSPLGRIPEEWEVLRLGEVSNKIIDGTHFTPQYSEDGIPFLRVVDLQGSTVNLDNVMRISPQEHRILSKRCFPEYGDILLSKNGTIGISKVVDWKWEFSIFVSICLIKPKHEKVINIYLKYFLDSEWIKKQIVKSTKQLSVVNLHLEEIREFFILLPPLPEQQRIAEILTQTDQTIEKEQQYKEKLQKIKQGLMQDLLTGKVRVNKLLEVENNELPRT
jgi:type I restriction enzyme S subunit